jgi:hypothetical protein
LPTNRLVMISLTAPVRFLNGSQRALRTREKSKGKGLGFKTISCRCHSERGGSRRGTLHWPTLSMLWMGAPALRAVRHSSHQYNRCPGFVRSLRSALRAPCGMTSVDEFVRAQLQIEPPPQNPHVSQKPRDMGHPSYFPLFTSPSLLVARSSKLLIVASYRVVPVHERALRVVAPSPDVELEE